MQQHKRRAQNLVALLVMAALWALPLTVAGQTRIKPRKNKYTIQQDVEIGQQVSRDAEKQLPILNDATATNYLQNIGRRLVQGIPPEFQQPEFRYNFKIVDAQEINAFALPGGPMYVNRGMIEMATSEGELAGVMAHELSHVALRHGTAQQTKATSAKSTIITLGSIIGGAILAGEAGAQIGAVGATAYLLKFSREYETESDILGAQMMAQADYDPEDLANVFRLIEKQSGGSGGTPGFLSSHPNPKDRYQRIQQERQLLRVSSNPIRQTRELARVQERLRSLPRRSGSSRPSGGQTGGGEQSSGGYTRNVPAPSGRYVTVSADVISFSIPDNWESSGDGSFAPQGAYGSEGITHGLIIGIARTQSSDLRAATDEYVQGVLRDNSYLKALGNNYARSTLSGRTALNIKLEGRSPVTQRNELVTIYTTQMRNGALLYLTTVVPTDEGSRYDAAFRQLRTSLRITD